MREPGIERGHALPARLRKIAQSAKRSSLFVLAHNWRGDPMALARSILGIAASLEASAGKR